MHVLSKIAIFLLAATTANAEAPAQSQAPHLVRELSPHVLQLAQPTYVYNWFNARHRNALWLAPLLSTTRAGYDHLQSVTQNYFQAFCTNDAALDPKDCTSEDVQNMFGKGNFYGPGLYTSVDPVATANYSGGPGWVLMQIRLPKGFRVASSSFKSGNDALSAEAINELKNLGCKDFDFADSASSVIDQMLKRGDENEGVDDHDANSKACTLATRRLLKDDLKVQAIFYSYEGTQFPECAAPVQIVNKTQSGNDARNSAFVLTNVDTLSPRDVQVFNAQTNDAAEDRTRIASLFYKADSNLQDNATIDNSKVPHAQWQMGALWADLNGQPRDPNLSAWIKQNLFGCQSQSPFATIDDDTYGAQR